MARRRRSLGRPKHWPGIPWLRGSGKARKKRRATGAAARKAPQHCRVDLSRCMKGGGRGKAGPCMRAFQRCKNGG